MPVPRAAPHAPRSRPSRGQGLLFALALVVAVWRAPTLLSEPRFWAEEATHYYAGALRADLLDSLFRLPRHPAGYVELSASLPATFAARALPIEWAPFATTYAALLAVATALALIAFGRSRFWDSVPRRAVACAIVLIAPSALGEAWLNSTNSQIYCGLIALCILCEDLAGASTRRLVAYTALMAICGLSGPYTSFLFPAFTWKLWLERSRGAFWVWGVNGVTASVQVLVFAQLWGAGALHAAKFSQLDWVRSGIYTFYTQCVTPLGARELVRWAEQPLDVLGSLSAASRSGMILALAVAGVLGTSLLGWTLLEFRARSRTNLLALSWICLVVLTTLSANYGRTTGRYAMLSGYALLLLLLAQARMHPGASRLRPLIAGGLLAFALAVGALGYRTDDAFVCPGGCPRWRDEVARWRLDPAYAPQVWPVRLPVSGPQWRVQLTDR